MVTEFRRGLPDAALRYLRTMPGWWRDVLDCRYQDGGISRPLQIAVRDGYLNAYAEGQSVLKIGFDARRMDQVELRCEIHRKYVLGGKAGDGYLIFDGLTVRGGGENGQPLSYSGPEMLQLWVEAARAYAGDEKKGVSAIAGAHPTVIDLEMALPADEPLVAGGKKAANRMDIVALEECGETIRLVFFEAKLFSNKELRARDGNAKVLRQLRGYRDYVAQPARREQVCRGYENACRLLAEISDMRGGSADPLIQAVASGTRLDIDIEPRLVVFGYADHQVDVGSSWIKHADELEKHCTVIAARSAQDICLEPGEPNARSVRRRRRLDALAAFLPIFEREDFQFGTVTQPERDGDVITMGDDVVSADTEAFIAAAYRHGWVWWFKWAAWWGSEEAQALSIDLASIGEANEDQLAKLLTAVIRGDRLNEGLLAVSFENGLIVHVLRRMSALAREPDEAVGTLAPARVPAHFG